MERIVIIDHDEHRLYIEDIDEGMLFKDYNGEEEAYIKDNYDVENFSWDYIVEAIYLPEASIPPFSDPITIDFNDFKL